MVSREWGLLWERFLALVVVYNHLHNEINKHIIVYN